MTAVSLMFSGGVDSTYSCLKLSEKYSDIYLLNFSNGYGQLHSERAESRFRKISAQLSCTIHFYHLNIRPLFEFLLVDSAVQDLKKYQSAFIWCLGCKTAMHAATTAFNNKHGIQYSSDGSSFATSEMVEQMPLSVELFRDFYNGFGQTFLTPSYTVSRDEEIEMLKKNQLIGGFRIKDRFLGMQPSCYPGELYYLPYVLFGIQPQHDPQKVAHFLKRKLKKASEIIKNGDIYGMLC